MAMGIKLHTKPDLRNPVLIASWPGIGNIGLIVVDTLRESLQAEQFGYIEPWDLFYPRKVTIRAGELKNLEFPGSVFYYKKRAQRDLILFIGDEQPSSGEGAYAQGKQAWHMANMVLDVAQDLGCRKIYTSGAAVSAIHHSMRPRVWAVPNGKELFPEIESQSNTVLMSDIEGRRGSGTISGLNGLLLGVAKQRKIPGICVMGEIPIYLQGFPLLYPKASKSVLEFLCSSLEIGIDLANIGHFADRIEKEIDSLYEKLPSDIKAQFDKLKQISPRTEYAGAITDEDKQKILDDIDKFFKRGSDGG